MSDGGWEIGKWESSANPGAPKPHFGFYPNLQRLKYIYVLFPAAITYASAN